MMTRKAMIPMLVVAVAAPAYATAPVADVVTPAKQEVRTKEVKAETKVTAPKKTAYINAMEAMQSSNQGSQRLAGMEKKRKDLGETIEKKEQQLKQRVTEYKSKETTLSSSAREKEEATLIKMRREFEGLVQSSEEELKLAMQRATEELSQEIEKAAAVLAQEGGFEVIIDVYTGRTIWASNDVMKTQDLVKVMNKQHSLASGKSAAPAKATAA